MLDLLKDKFKILYLKSSTLYQHCIYALILAWILGYLIRLKWTNHMISIKKIKNIGLFDMKVVLSALKSLNQSI